MPYDLIHADCFEWLAARAPNSIHAVCTDPPYGLVEFSDVEKRKLRAGRGGVWRIPPTLDGQQRSPLPRFSVLTLDQRRNIEQFFTTWGEACLPALVPGAHVVVASNPTLAPHVQIGLMRAGLEIRGTVIRTYWTFRGGDRPKNAEKEFPEVSVSPRGAYEPWLLFRKPVSEQTVAKNLTRWGTGALRRPDRDRPFSDVMPGPKATKQEERIADHPCLKPQLFMRALVRSLLPLARGVVLDTFMGSGATIAAADALGYDSIGIEADAEYFTMAENAVPKLAALSFGEDGSLAPASVTALRTASMF